MSGGRVDRGDADSRPGVGDRPEARPARAAAPRLATEAVLTEATPGGLAAFAERGPDEEKLVDRPLADDRLLVEMATADGAKNGRYGKSLQIYDSIQKASDKARAGTLQRLALAIALEHAQPVAQRNATGKKDAPATVDPGGRFRPQTGFSPPRRIHLAT